MTMLNNKICQRRVYNQLISDAGEKFTEEEAQYAVDHLDK